MFWFLLIAMVVVVAAVTLAVVGGDRPVLQEAGPQHLVDPLPESRPVGRADVDALRLPVAARGYRMADVDDVLGRLGAELAERDARIAELESALAGAQAAAVSRPGLYGDGAPGGGAGAPRGHGPTATDLDPRQGYGSQPYGPQGYGTQGPDDTARGPRHGEDGR